jgi:uncharacterized protein YjbI with pentapeptide repeats
VAREVTLAPQLSRAGHAFSSRPRQLSANFDSANFDSANFDSANFDSANFDSVGLTAPFNPGQRLGAHCMVIAGIQHGQGVRIDPKSGLECDGTYHDVPLSELK